MIADLKLMTADCLHLSLGLELMTADLVVPFLSGFCNTLTALFEFQLDW